MPRRAASSTNKIFTIPSYRESLAEEADVDASVMMQRTDNAIGQGGGLPSRYVDRKEILAYGADQTGMATSGLYTPMTVSYTHLTLPTKA